MLINNDTTQYVCTQNVIKNNIYTLYINNCNKTGQVGQKVLEVILVGNAI